MAREVSTRGVKVIGEPARYGAQSFLLYGVPVWGGGAVVVTSDAVPGLGAGFLERPYPASAPVSHQSGDRGLGGMRNPGRSRATDSDTVKTYFATRPASRRESAPSSGYPGVADIRRGRCPRV